jgi:hypothetical protein
MARLEDNLTRSLIPNLTNYPPLRSAEVKWESTRRYANQAQETGRGRYPRRRDPCADFSHDEGRCSDVDRHSRQNGVASATQCDHLGAVSAASFLFLSCAHGFVVRLSEPRRIASATLDQSPHGAVSTAPFFLAAADPVTLARSRRCRGHRRPSKCRRWPVGVHGTEFWLPGKAQPIRAPFA